MLKSLKHAFRVAHSIVRERLVKRVARSGEWPTVRKHFLEAHPHCIACGGTKRLQVHHEIPFKTDPTLELDPSNLVVLCMDSLDCHVRLGHSGSYRYYNPNIIQDAAIVLADPEKFETIVELAEAHRIPNK